MVNPLHRVGILKGVPPFPAPKRNHTDQIWPPLVRALLSCTTQKSLKLPLTTTKHSHELVHGIVGRLPPVLTMLLFCLPWGVLAELLPHTSSICVP